MFKTFVSRFLHFIKKPNKFISHNNYVYQCRKSKNVISTVR
ncbi:hypothetical protein BC792_11725 [Sphingobacterium allocomposti]|uniref:Uncharacterized protein n=1 Tax=Sphingobacterium allocomposti TaxID=415956 RepID=A0A5S5D8A9_9SPHI|nr:hypothetical protein BC792_11725 [Sphingobacterium composti Yoo et al. 2007 non Ten et al. 2007]